MAKKEKPIKIKRHKNVMSKGVGSTLKSIFTMALGIVLVIAIGFMLGKPVLSFFENINDKANSIQSSEDSSQPTSEDIDNENTTDEGNSEPTDESQTQEGEDTGENDNILPDITDDETLSKKYFYTSSNGLTTSEQIDSEIKTAKEKGATHFVFDLKNADGKILYATENEYGKQLLSNIQIDVKLIVEKCKSNGIIPVARIYTFMDKELSNIVRETAVMYTGTETRWLDSSIALGGKPWSNPANKIVQEYITSITNEILSLGVKDIIFAGYTTPTGYSLDKRDFGASMDQVLANMTSLMNTLKAKISSEGGHAVWEIEYSAIMPDGNYAQYIVHPYQLGADNIIVTAKGNDIDVRLVSEQLLGDSKSNDIDITLWLTDGVNSDLTHSMKNYFVN